MSTLRTIAATAAVTMLTGLGTLAGTTASEAGTGGSPGQAATFEVTATVNNTEPEQGDTITIRGSVTPGKAGAVVVLQKRYGTTGAWKMAGTDTLNGKGRFTFKARAGRVGFRHYRVVKHADGTAGAGRSPNLGVTVYGWRELTSLTPAGAIATSETDSALIKGISYPQSLIGYASGTGGVTSYPLNRDCKRFEGQVGLSDTSAATSIGDITLKRRTTTLYANSFGLTESEAVVLDLTGVHMLSVWWSSTDTEGTPEDESGAVIAVGIPRVLCSF